jgi:peroxiredoxin
MSKIKVGATLHDFELPDENGDLHRLSELQGEDLMVLSLGRGEHCPRERQHQRELLRFYEWCSVAFTQLVTILPNDLHDVSKLKLSTGSHWTYLADTDLEMQTALDIREYTDPIHPANVPHTLILSPGLKIEKAYVGYWFWGRPSPYQLWQDLQELSMQVKPDFDPTTPAAKRAWKAATANGKVPAHH